MISDPKLDRDRVLSVNVTTWTKHKEQTCLLGADDHPEMEHNSCVPFVFARLHSDAHLEHLVATEQIVLKQPVSPELLAIIREAAGRSIHLKLDMGQLLIDQGLVDP